MAGMNATGISTFELTGADQSRLVAALQQALRVASGGTPVELIETHLSYLLIAGEQAYKIKKALNLGFADFSTLAQRRFYCEEELRLNRRTAPQLYLQVIAVTGTPEQPVLGGAGTAIDWVLHMRAFSQDGLWDRLAVRGALGTAQIDALVEVLCDFHRLAAVAGADTDYGRPEQLRAPMRDNLSALGSLCPAGEEREGLQRLTQWEAQEFETLRSAFGRRRDDGRVRDAHGDLHLGNVTQFEGRPLLFDCLEFSAALRWTDVMSDVAFMAMDLASHGLDALSNRFVNAYVESSGDADGLRVLRYYRVHRALVRAKVAALRAAQLGAASAPVQAESAAASQARQHYLQAALRSSRHAAPVLMLTHGLSGSGKTTLTQDLLELSGAIRFRADVERKRLFGLAALERSDAALKAQLYSRDATRATQTRLRELARTGTAERLQRDPRRHLPGRRATTAGVRAGCRTGSAQHRHRLSGERRDLARSCAATCRRCVGGRPGRTRRPARACAAAACGRAVRGLRVRRRGGNGAVTHA